MNKQQQPDSRTDDTSIHRSRAPSLNLLDLTVPETNVTKTFKKMEKERDKYAVAAA